jgi:hypothetical protein
VYICVSDRVSNDLTEWGWQDYTWERCVSVLCCPFRPIYRKKTMVVRIPAWIVIDFSVNVIIFLFAQCGLEANTHVPFTAVNQFATTADICQFCGQHHTMWVWQVPTRWLVAHSAHGCCKYTEDKKSIWQLSTSINRYMSRLPNRTRVCAQTDGDFSLYDILILHIFTDRLVTAAKILLKLISCTVRTTYHYSHIIFKISSHQHPYYC